jgi:hypothetical protein
MRVFGTVTNAKTEQPIKGAKVSLFIGEQELAILYTDSKGGFEHSATESYSGKTLTFIAEKKGFNPQEATYDVENEEVPFNIELVPIEVASWWEKPKKWIIENKKWIAIGAGVIVVAILLLWFIDCGSGTGGTQEDCISFDYRNAEAKVSAGMWKIMVGNMSLLAFPNETEARKALSIIKHYKMNSQCFVGRPGPSLEYYLVDGQAPSGPFPGEDCIPFNLANIEVKQINGRWKIVEGSHWILDFESNEDEARLSYQIIKKYGFTKICFVGRPDASMIYFRK